MIDSLSSLSALSSVTSGNALAGLGASAGISTNVSPDLSAALKAIGTGASTQVSLSQLAQGLLAQQANDPTLDIDTAVATTLSDLLSAQDPANGQLYTATGQLQQFAGALLLTSAGSASATNAQTLQVLADAAQPVIPGDAQPVPATQTEAQRLQDIADAARQAFQSSQFTALDTPATDTQNDTAAQTSAAAITAARAAAVPVPADTAVVNAAAASTAASVASSETATADTQADNTLTTAQTTQDATAAANQTPAASTSSDLAPTTSDILDPYQQAALASGLTTFGKELNTFVPGALEADFPAAVRAVTAVRPVVPRRDEPEQATVNASA